MIHSTLKSAMRFFILSLTLILFFLNFSSAQDYREFTGQSANDLIRGTEMVIMDQQNELPVFIRFDGINQPQLSTVDLLFSKIFNAKKVTTKRVEEDKLGFMHYRYQQMHEGYPVLGAEYIIHTKDGIVQSMNGKFFKNFSSVVSPSVSESSALNLVLSNVAANIYKWEMTDEEELLKYIMNDPNATYYPHGSLVFVPIRGDFTNSEFRLCWEFDVFAHEPMTRERIYMDATTGEIIFRENRIQHTDVLGTATTAYSGTTPFTSDSYSGIYRMRENDRGIGSGMETFDMNNGTNYSNAVDFVHPDPDWNSFSPSIDQYATDAHFGTEMAYDYFYNVHGRNSYDNTGTTLFSYVHYGNNYDNAFWNGTAMTYGDGGGGYFTSPLTTMDVCGHEITHAVTQYTAGLIYSYEPGQLNESFSDIFGTAIEWWATPTYADWLIGDDCIAGGMRSMSNPNAFGQPDTYLGSYWYFGSGDNGGVHYNSGVQNFWYYLLVNGGSGTNDNGDVYSVTGQGLSDADDIAFRNLSVYLTPSSQHADSRIGAIAAATDLFGACSAEVESVTNAWYAVGVGAAYSASVTADFSATPTSACSAPATIQFINLSTNGSTYVWNFGDGSTSNAVSPLHTYNSTGLYTVTLSATSSCGSDSETKTNYINIDNSLPCNMIPNGTLTIGSCTGTLYDSGGSGSDYQDNENSIVVISPSGATSVSITFTSFFLETGYDYLYIYNGPNTASPLLGFFDGNTLPNGGAAITANSGSMTIQLISDVSVTELGFVANWTCSQGIPVAEFSGYYLSSCSGTVNYTDLSIGDPTSWAWDFGDGNTSNQQNPSHDYTANGTYNVSLTATNGFGSDTETKSGYINVSKPAGPTTTDATICDAGNATLTSSGSNVTWHTDATGGSQVGTGSPFTFSAPSTTTYYAQNTVINADGVFGETDINSNGSYFANTSEQWLIFTVTQSCLLQSVQVNANGSGNRTIYITNSGGTTLLTTTVNLPNGISTVNLNWVLPVGTNLQFHANNGADLYRNNVPSTITYPYNFGSYVSITGSSAGANRYYFYYNWSIQTEDCVSLRTAATAFVSDLAISTSSTPSSCSGNTGTATATVTSGSYPSFTYAWSNGGNTGTITGLAAGTYTVTVTDDLNCTRISSVVVGTAGDAVPPTITTCPSNTTVNLNGSCQITLADYVPSTVATDNCGSVTITQSPVAGTVISGVGTTTVTMTATDGSGNTATCQFIVTRADVSAPSITTCPGTQTQFLNGSCQITLSDYTSSVVASDNCSSVTKTQSPSAGTVITGVGTTSVTVTCTDASGNSSTCTFNVSRVDNTAPSITTCPSTQTQFLNGSCQITLADYTSMVISSDNCSSVTKTQSPASGTLISGVGTTSVTVTCTDASGNSTTCTFNVLRVDNTAPVMSGCPSNIISNSPVVFWTAPTASDNCSSITMTSNHNPGDTFPLGTTTVNYVATDATGNSALCTFTVTYVSSSGAPVNDNCIDAINLSSTFSKYTFMSSALNCVSIVGTNLNSTVEAGEAGSGCSTNDVTVWYRFVSPTCGPFTMDLSTDNPNTNFDTVVDLLYSPNGTCDFSQMVVVGCNDDASGGCIGGSSALNSTFSTASLVTGGVYYVKVDGASAATGTFELTLTVEPAPTVLTGGTYPATEMNVAWTNANGNHYNLYWKRTFFNGYASATGISGTSYLLQNLLPSTSYDVQLKNVCIPNGVEKYYSPVSTLSTAASTCSSPGMPFCVTQTINSITIGWTNVPAAVYYKIFWRKVGNPGYAIVNSVTSTTWTFNNLLLGTDYEFWVRAVCSINNPSENVTGPHGFCFTLGLPKLGSADVKQADYQYNFNGATYFNWDPADLNIDIESGTVDIVNDELVITEIFSANTRNKFSVYPNPASLSATLNVELAAEGDVVITVYDIQGKTLKTIRFAAQSTSLTYILSLDDLSGGIYTVTVQSGSEIQTQKLAVVR